MLRQQQITIKTDTITLTLAEMGVIIANKGTALTLSVPAAAGYNGLWYYIINIGAGECTVDETGGGTLATLKQNDACDLVCDGTAWRVAKSGTIHNNLTGLNAGDYVHLTAAEYAANVYSSDLSCFNFNNILVSTGWDILCSSDGNVLSAEV
jgi:hypothetical protein